VAGTAGKRTSTQRRIKVEKATKRVITSVDLTMESSESSGDEGIKISERAEPKADGGVKVKEEVKTES
jgi:hypothetical protein